MKTIKTIETYRCEHCNKAYRFKRSCLAHERRCYKEPKTKSCESCVFLKPIGYEKHNGYVITLLTCLKNHLAPRDFDTDCIDYKFIKEKFAPKNEQKARAIYNHVNSFSRISIDIK